MLLILDIDGTLANLDQRAHFVEKDDPTPEDWDRFFDPEIVAKDTPIKEAQAALKSMHDDFEKVIFITGRPEHLRETTVQWLSDHFGFTPSEDELYMRPDGSTERSSKLKKEILDGKVKELYGDMDWAFIDDEDDNLKMFDAYGTTEKAPECWDAHKDEAKMATKQLAKVLDRMKTAQFDPAEQVLDLLKTKITPWAQGDLSDWDYSTFALDEDVVYITLSKDMIDDRAVVAIAIEPNEDYSFWEVEVDGQLPVFSDPGGGAGVQYHGVENRERRFTVPGGTPESTAQDIMSQLELDNVVDAWDEIYEIAPDYRNLIS